MSDDRHPLVRGLHGLFNSIEQQTAENNYPQPKIDEEDEVKRTIIEMLTESTGVDILDSGGSYGRSWQRNRAVKDWDKTPSVNMEIWEDGDYIMTASVYHWLTAMLSIDDETKALEKEFYEYAEANDDYWLTNMQDFAKMKNWDYSTINTYNGDCALSQTLQYVYCHENDLILLQIHNGADVRGGYTNPKVFKADEGFMFYNDFDAECDTCHGRWVTDDMGYHWYHANEHREHEFGIAHCGCDETLCEHPTHKHCGGKLSIHNRS